MSTTTQHGATQPGDRSDIDSFSGTEGLLVATKLAKQIKLYLGSFDSREFLTTPKEEILDNIRSQLEDQPSLLYKEVKSIKERWSKTYSWIRSHFKDGSTADSHFIPCDEEMDIPMLWKIFQKHYLGGENIRLARSILQQQIDPKLVLHDPLNEFTRQFKLEVKIESLEQASSQTSISENSSPSKPRVARALSFETAARSTSPATATLFSEAQTEFLAKAFTTVLDRKKKKK
jgi:hypothetical protein